jgi:hypothetical protein
MPDFNRQLDAATLLNQAAVECGLSPALDPLASLEQTFVQLRFLLTSCGRELLTAYPWQFLVREQTVSVYRNESGEYALPSDFQKMLSMTVWDQTSKQPMSGSLSPQDWQYVKISQIGFPDTTVGFRLANDKIKIYPPPPAGVGLYFNFSYEYVSRGWVRYETTPAPLYRDNVVLSSDVILYDSNLLVKMLKLRFLGAKGFDTKDAQAQFQSAWTQATDSDSVSETLSIVPGIVNTLLDPISVSNIG